MAFVAALLPNKADRESLKVATPPHEILWADTWRDLYKTVRRRPVAAVIADLHAESRKDGALRVFRFTQRYPLTPLVVWGEADGRELFRLGKAGAADIILSSNAENAELVRDVVDRVIQRSLAPAIEERLVGRILGRQRGRRIR